MALNPNAVLSGKKIPQHRSGFDMTAKNLFSAKVGEILPVAYTYMMPGESYKINLDWFTRTVPVNTAAYTRIREYYDVFAVPLRLMGVDLNNAFTQMDDYSVSAASYNSNSSRWTRVPCTTSKDIGDLISNNYQLQDIFFPWCYGALKLCDYLRYGPLWSSVSNTPSARQALSSYTGIAVDDIPADADNPWCYAWSYNVNLLFAAAYQKIYFDYFSDSQWEDTKAYAYNFDWWTANAPIQSAQLSPELFRLRYCNYPKDMFFGMVPNSQYGDVAVLPAIDSSDVPTSVLLSNRGDMSSDPVGRIYNDESQQELLSSNVSGSRRSAFLNSDLSVLSIRAAEYLQRWKEIVQFGNKDYCEQMYRQFGIRPPEYMGNMCHYVGGHSSDINISEVVNNNLTSAGSQAVIAGKGVSSSSSRILSYKNGMEPAILMVVYHAVPMVDWDLSGIHPQLLCTNIDEFPQPAFDQLGLQAVPTAALDNSKAVNAANGATIGYNLRYWQFKGDVDTVHGAFREGLAYQSWVAPVDGWRILNSSRAMDYISFKVRPDQLNPIFEPQVGGPQYGVDKDQLLCNSNVTIRKVSPLDRDGLPY